MEKNNFDDSKMKWEIINYYIKTREMWENYHSHKEKTAWTSLALFLVYIGASINIEVPTSKVIYEFVSDNVKIQITNTIIFNIIY